MRKGHQITKTPESLAYLSHKSPFFSHIRSSSTDESSGELCRKVKKYISCHFFVSVEILAGSFSVRGLRLMVLGACMFRRRIYLLR